METERNMAVVRQVFSEIANRGDLARVAVLYRTDFVDHNPFPGAPRGRVSAEFSIGRLRLAMPDLQVTVEAMSAHGDKVAAHNTWSGTHTGEVLGIPPTGRRISFGGVVVFRLVDGLLAERWAIGMELNLLKELGLNLRWSPAAVPTG